MEVTRLKAFFAVLLVLAVVGCASHGALSSQDKEDGKTLWTHRYQYVRLVPREQCQGADTVANSHPRDLGGKLRAALASLQIDLPAKEKTEPVFTYYELEKITGPLVEAFKKAGPDEDVGLAIEGMHSGEFGTQRCMITARLFIRNGDELNVIFGKLHMPVDDYDSPMHIESTDYRMNPLVPGSRCEKAGKKFPTIITTNLARFHEQEGSQRKNWLTVSLATQPQAPPTTPAPASPPPVYQASPQASPPAVQAPGQTAPPAPAYQAPRQATSPAVQDTNRITPPPAQQPAKSVLERLQILKDLRVKGLITEQEYQEKKKEILESL